MPSEDSGFMHLNNTCTFKTLSPPSQNNAKKQKSNVIVRIPSDLGNVQQRHYLAVGGIHRGDEIIGCGQEESHDRVTALLRDWPRQLNPCG